MGLMFVLEFEQEIGFSTDSAPTNLFRFPEVFEPIAIQRGLTSFETFISYPSANKWFGPSEALKTVRGFLDHLRANKRSIRGAAQFIEDLSLVEQDLAAAERKGVRFYVTTTQALDEARLVVGSSESEYQQSFDHLLHDPQYHPN